MHEYETRRAIRDIETRLDRIEALLQIATPDADDPAAGATGDRAPGVASATTGNVVPSPAAAVPQPAPPSVVSPTTPARPITTAARSAPPTQRATTSPSTPKRSLEETIGRYWIAWVGSIVVVVGVGLFVKFAYDEGWIQNLAPTVRCLLAAVFGGLLVGAGEVALRRFGRTAGTGLFSAGLGTWYLTVYAAVNMNIASETGALGLLAAVSVAGFALTWRTRHLAIGVLSVVVGYGTVLFLGPLGSLPTGTPMYLTMLLGVALALSGVSRQPFRPLRYVALAIHGVVALTWILWAPNESAMMLPFIVIWWAMVAIEAIWAGLREQSPIGNAVASLMSTAWFVLVGTFILLQYIQQGEAWLGAFLVAVALVAGAAAMHFGPGIESLRRRPTRAIDHLSIVLWCEAAVLTTVAIAAQWDGWGTATGWLTLGLAGVEVGRRLRARGVTVFGLVVGSLGVVHVATISRFDPALTATTTHVLNVAVTPWLFLSLATTVAMIVAARRVASTGDDGPSSMATIMTGLAAVGWCLLWQVAGDGLAPMWAWTIGGAGLVLAHRVGRRHGYLEIGSTVLGITICRWALELLQTRLAVDWTPTTTPFLNEASLVGLLAIAGAVWAIRTLHRIPNTEFARGLSGLVASIAIVGILFNVEHLIATLEANGLQTIWDAQILRTIWLSFAAGACGAILMLLARWLNWPALGAYGGAILGSAACAWMLGATLLPRLSGPAVDAVVIANPQFGVGLALLLLAGVVIRVWPRDRWPEEARRAVVAFLATVIASVGFWLGILEIDRIFAGATEMAARQTGFSIYGGIYGATLIVIGFIRKIPVCRYAGLALFGVVVAKVLIVDMAEVDRVWRVASFVIVGLVLLATSVGYARVAQRGAISPASS